MTAKTFLTTQECFLPMEMPIKSRDFYDVSAINIAKNLAVCKHNYVRRLLKPLNFKKMPTCAKSLVGHLYKADAPRSVSSPFFHNSYCTVYIFNPSHHWTSISGCFHCWYKISIKISKKQHCKWFLFCFWSKNPDIMDPHRSESTLSVCPLVW